MTEGPSAAAAHRAAIQKRRDTRSLRASLTAVSVGQLLFACFAFGHAQGPLPPRPLELGFGAALALGLSLAFAGLTQRRHQDAGAAYQAVLHEGKKRRRLAIHDSYLSLDGEIVPLETIDYARLQGEQLLLRYLDPEVGPVLRTLSGPPTVLSALHRRLERRPITS